MRSSRVHRQEAEFEEFVRRASGRLLRTAQLLTSSQQDAEDLVQTVLLRMFARWSSVEQVDPVGYARRALSNAAIDSSRRRKGRVDLLVADPPDRLVGGAWPDEHAARDEAARALAVLTVRERAVVVLRFFEDMTEAEVATTLDMPLGSVKSTGHRALQKLRRHSHVDELRTRGR